MDIMKTLEVNLPEREVFDPNEAPYTLISAFSTQDMVKISVRPQEDYILNTKMREYISIYNEIEKNLNAIDSERSNLIFLHKSPYSQVYRVFCGLVVDD